MLGGSICSAPDATLGGGNLAPTCTPTTCAGAADTCQPYPGSTRDSCTDGPNGYAATCCFAPDAPICFAVGASAGCNGTAGPGGTVTCPDPPRCATASDACAAYPGATLQGCTDNDHGYTGGCCFAPQAPVCVAVTVERGCSGAAPGGGGITCSAPPRCEDANPCAQYAGGTVKSCTNTDSGFTATCCFAAGTLPASSGPSSGGNGVATGGSGGGGPVDSGGTGGRTGGTGGLSGTTGGGGTTATGGTSGGGATAGGGTTGAGGIIGGDPGTCAPDAACQPGEHCASKTPDTCVDCTCGADGRMVCQSCLPGTGGTSGTGGLSGGGGTSGGGTSGGTGGTGGGPADTCVPGAVCSAGQVCGTKTADGSCLECNCDQNGQFVCNPCPGSGAGGTTGGGGSTGGGGTTGGTPDTCAPGAVCSAGQVCGAKTADGSCLECNCDPNGQFVCDPCPGAGTGGTTGGTGSSGAGGTSGGSGTCALMTMPPQNGTAPCSVTELCPDGSAYAVKCDGISPCVCSGPGTATSAPSTVSCASFDPLQALSACGFPPGKI